MFLGEEKMLKASGTRLSTNKLHKRNIAEGNNQTKVNLFYHKFNLLISKFLRIHWHKHYSFPYFVNEIMFSILLDYIFIHVLTNTWQVRLRVRIFIYIHEHRIITFSPSLLTPPSLAGRHHLETLRTLRIPSFIFRLWKTHKIQRELLVR